MAKKESIKISFLWLKVEILNPGMRSIIILVLLLIFFVVLVVLARKLIDANVALDRLGNGMSTVSGMFKK